MRVSLFVYRGDKDRCETPLQLYLYMLAGCKMNLQSSFNSQKMDKMFDKAAHSFSTFPTFDDPEWKKWQEKCKHFKVMTAKLFSLLRNKTLDLTPLPITDFLKIGFDYKVRWLEIRKSTPHEANSPVFARFVLFDNNIFIRHLFHVTAQEMTTSETERVFQKFKVVSSNTLKAKGQDLEKFVPNGYLLIEFVYNSMTVYQDAFWWFPESRNDYLSKPIQLQEDWDSLELIDTLATLKIPDGRIINIFVFPNIYINLSFSPNPNPNPIDCVITVNNYKQYHLKHCSFHYDSAKNRIVLDPFISSSNSHFCFYLMGHELIHRIKESETDAVHEVVDIYYRTHDIKLQEVLPLDHVFDDIKKIRFMITNPPFIKNDFLFTQILSSDICAAVLKPPNNFLIKHFMVFAKSSDDPNYIDIRSDITELTKMSPLKFSNTFFCEDRERGIGVPGTRMESRKVQTQTWIFVRDGTRKKRISQRLDEQFLEYLKSKYLKRQRLNT